MKRRAIVALMAMTMTATTLTGCSFDFGLFSTPKTAADVIERYSAKETEANYNMSGTLTMEIGMDAQGMSVAIPIDLEFDMDMAGKAAHGDMVMSASFMGESMKESAEMYISDGKVYMYDSDLECWTVSDSDFESNVDGIFAAGLFETAELVVDKKAKTYTVNQSFGDFMENDDLKDTFEESAGGVTDMFDMDEDDIEAAFQDAVVTYVFDTDCNLLSVALDGCSYKDEVSEDGVTAEVYLNLGFDFDFSKFGEIDEDDVTVPKSVKNEAIDDSDTDSGIMDSFGGDNDVSATVPDEPLVPDAPSIPSTPGLSESENSPSVTVAGSDVLGAYKGTPITSSANSWSMFESDGWVFDNEDGEYSFMSCVNDKYEDASLYVYNKDADDTTRSDITDYGFYGYDIDVSWSDNKPDMTFNGLTWGASDSDVTSAYGTPDYTYTGSMYTSYEYEISKNVDMTFYVYFDEGLQKVSLDVYNY